MTDAELLGSSISPAREIPGRAPPAGINATRRSVGPAERVLLRALLGLRWTGLALSAVVVIAERHHLQRPATANLALLTMVVLTAGLTVTFLRHEHLLLHPTVVAAEVAVAFGVRVADGWAFGPFHRFTASLALVWVLGAVATAGIAWGPRAGFLAGLVATAGGWIGTAAPDLSGRPRDLFQDTPRLLPLLTNLTLFAVAGYGAGFINQLLRRSHDQIADLRARQHVASVLHDGTLQALAYISRRAADPDIARVARDADTELRGYLSATLTPDSGELGAALLTAARRIEQQLDGQLRLAVDDELPDRPPAVVAALTGAITEALTNAAKHANAAHVTLFATADDTNGVRLSVIDDGDGFHPDHVPAGGGLDQSIRARLRAVGGTATVRSTPGAGTEVELWAP